MSASLVHNRNINRAADLGVSRTNLSLVYYHGQIILLVKQCKTWLIEGPARNVFSRIHNIHFSWKSEMYSPEYISKNSHTLLLRPKVWDVLRHRHRVNQKQLGCVMVCRLDLWKVLPEIYSPEYIHFPQRNSSSLQKLFREKRNISKNWIDKGKCCTFIICCITQRLLILLEGVHVGKNEM